MSDTSGAEHGVTTEVATDPDGLPAFGSVQQRLDAMVRNFDDPAQEWRRLCAELFGTFFLVLVAAGGPMIDHAIPGSVGRAAAVVAPGLMVMAIILFMGRVSGAHLNPAVSLAFSLRRDFPWRRVPGVPRRASWPGPCSPPGSSRPSSTCPPGTAPNYPGPQVTARSTPS